MKLTTFILMISLMQVSAASFGQKLTLKDNNISIDKVFREIRKQTGYSVVLRKSKLNTSKTIAADFNNSSLDQVMDKMLSGTEMTYLIEKGSIVVIRKDKTFFERVLSKLNAIDIRGRVISEAGQPLAGATVSLKGSTVSVTTDVSGHFFIKNVQPDAILIVSYLGYEKLEVKASEDLQINLKVATNPLDEVKIIAYGQTTQRLTTGNMAVIRSKDIEKQTVDNPLLALQGRVPGLNISQSTGLPNSGVTVRIQGQNSLSKGNDPLYVIDGLPYTSQLLPTINSILGGSGGANINNVGSGSGNPLSFLSPSEIESITVLKDADATSIYGSRAANGAIIITTKKGKAGKTKLDVNIQSGVGKVTHMIDLLNTQQYLAVRKEAFKNDGVLNIPITNYDIALWDTTRYTNWQKTLIGNSAHFTKAHGTFSGGTSNTQFLIGGSYNSQTTVFPGDLSDKKGDIHFNINNTSADQKFNITLSSNYLNDISDLQATDLTNIALTLAPDAPNVYNVDGTLNWAPNLSGSSTWNNPYSNLYIPYIVKTSNLISNAAVSYKFFKELSFKTTLGYAILRSNEFQTFKMDARKPEDRPTATRAATFANSEISTWNIEPQLNYHKNTSKGSFDILIGGTLQKNTSNLLQLRGSGYNSDLVLQDIKSAGTITAVNSIDSKYRYNAMFGRLGYNWNDKYLINITGRRDGSSRFGPENLFHNFGSIGAAWIFSNETFFKKSLPIISFGKLRGSFGTTGNDQIGDYQFLNLYSPTTASVAYGGVTGLAPNGITNPYLQWEETKKMQIGLDLGFASDLILFNVTYFNNKSSNQLLSYTLPNTTGFSNIYAYNFPAVVQNSGWEFSANSNITNSTNTAWSLNFNLTIPKNKLLRFDNLETSAYANTYIIGQPITVTRVYHYLGVNSQTGLYQVADKNGIPTSSPSFNSDAKTFINTAPKFYGGLGSSFRYKSFDLDVFLQFVKQVGTNYLFGAYPGTAQNQPLGVLDRWTKPGDIATVRKLSALTSSDIINIINSNSAAISSDGVWTDASFVRLKNVSLGWSLPKKYIDKIGIGSCRLFVQGQNLYTLTNYKGLDPETKSTTSLPPLKVCMMGIQVSF